MRLPARPRAGMAGMKVGFVNDFETFRLKRPGELFFHSRLDHHDVAILFRDNDAP